MAKVKYMIQNYSTYLVLQKVCFFRERSRLEETHSLSFIPHKPVVSFYVKASACNRHAVWTRTLGLVRSLSGMTKPRNLKCDMPWPLKMYIQCAAQNRIEI